MGVFSSAVEREFLVRTFGRNTGGLALLRTRDVWCGEDDRQFASCSVSFSGSGYLLGSRR